MAGANTFHAENPLVGLRRSFVSVPSQKVVAYIGAEAPGSRGARRAHIVDMQPTSNEASRDASAAR
jgi:hypothetical protein